jgi:hypothetical protein
MFEQNLPACTMFARIRKRNVLFGFANCPYQQVWAENTTYHQIRDLLIESLFGEEL